MEKIETETEFHRSQKAVKSLLTLDNSPNLVRFEHSDVNIKVSIAVAQSFGGQIALALLVNQLARMKSLINRVALSIPWGIPILERVPLDGNDLRDGLEQLVASLSGPASEYQVNFTFDRYFQAPTVGVVLGREGIVLEGDEILVEADAWTAFIHFKEDRSNWNTHSPFGAMLAATLATAEIFKRILISNYPDQVGRTITFLDNVFFSALSLADWTDSDKYPPLQVVNLERVAIAGLGAGGSAAVYALSALPNLVGDIHLIEPGLHKRSNLGRYLLSTYDDCFTGTSKVNNAGLHLQKHHPGLSVHTYPMEYQAVEERNFEILISAVDTPEARWDLQRDWPPYLIDAGVVQTIYTLLTVTPGVNGQCLGCKHPYDPEAPWRRRARVWGKTSDEWRTLYLSKTRVTEADIRTLAKVQGHDMEEYKALVGVPFDEVPTITECGQSHFHLQEPNQVGTLPFVTTMAGILLAAELVKKIIAPEHTLENHFSHDLFHRPKSNLIKWRPRKTGCHLCSSSHSVNGGNK